MKIGIMVAMDKEFMQLRTLLDDSTAEHGFTTDYVCGKMGGNDVILQQCGIGKVNSAIGAVEMINRFSPDLVVSSGVAGGADVCLSPLDVVVSTECTYHDAYCGSECEYGQIMGMPSRFTAPSEYVCKALECGNVTSGLIVSGDWFVDSRQKMADILQHFPNAKAVDMESCSIAHTCYKYQVPFISFRIISDVPLKDENAAQYFDFWNRMAEGSFNVTRSFIQKLS